jgi:YggT family protein|tara:strand:- start:115 stop:366 length:252 start_codon:yes stop_codon:yes gene_type:complete
MDLLGIVGFVGTALYLAILARVILTWFPGQTGHPLAQLVFAITEPILRPIRRVVPTFGMLDLSPMIALILIMVIQTAFQRVLA